jgi:SAM-dependent methyltransferase
MNTRELGVRYDTWHRDGPAAAGRTHALDPRDLRFFAWATGLLRAVPGESLLDVACGQGAYLQFAARSGLVTTGVDLSRVALQVARERAPTARVQLGDGERLPFRDAAFDHVTCLGSLEHFPSPQSGAREIARVLRPRGSALVFVPNLYFLGHVYFGWRHGTQPSEGHQQFSEQFMTTRGWQALLEGAGLRVESVHPWNYIYATRKVSQVTIALWNGISRFLPLHAAYAFGYVCRAAEQAEQ